MFIFIDESGDLGFSQNSTKHFIVGALTLNEPKEMQKIFKKARNKLKKKLSDIPEFKFSKTDEDMRTFILEQLARTEVSFYAYFIDKQNTKNSNLKETPPILYNFIVGRLIEHVLLTEGTNHTTKVHIVLDRSLYKSARNSFDDYIMQFRTPLKLKENLCIDHKKSDEECSLQAVDFFCGALFHKLEHKNTQYYDLIKNKIKIINKMW
ncbi:MAG: DUF3800 domain-containing protein [Candidatus Micrarchaeota archaeon]